MVLRVSRVNGCNSTTESFAFVFWLNRLAPADALFVPHAFSMPLPASVSPFISPDSDPEPDSDSSASAIAAKTRLVRGTRRSR